VYSLDFLRTQQGVDNISADLALGMGVLGNVSGAIVAPLSGYLCDRVGVGKMFLAGQVCRGKQIQYRPALTSWNQSVWGFGIYSSYQLVRVDFALFVCAWSWWGSLCRINACSSGAG
jgi:hypothetical protein